MCLLMRRLQAVGVGPDAVGKVVRLHLASAFLDDLGDAQPQAGRVSIQDVEVFS